MKTERQQLSNKVVLAMWSRARIELETAVQLGSNTVEGKVAQQWLDRFKKPLNVAMFNIDIEDVHCDFNPRVDITDYSKMKSIEKRINE